jgi:molybdenum cofactor synthesis domain-containing protein
VKAGDPPGLALPEGRAVEIMTGAPVPDGATGVQQLEKTRLAGGGASVELLEPVTPGQNVSPRASEVRAGDRVLEAGIVIDAATVGVLAAVGAATVAVGRRPRVAIVVTGDEIVDVAARPAPGQIRNSNGPAIAAQVRAAGGEVAVASVAPDEPEALARLIDDGLRHDVLVLSGGVSKGAYDLVEGVLEEAGSSCSSPRCRSSRERPWCSAGGERPSSSAFPAIRSPPR